MIDRVPVTTFLLLAPSSEMRVPATCAEETFCCTSTFGRPSHPCNLTSSSDRDSFAASLIVSRLADPVIVVVVMGARLGNTKSRMWEMKVDVKL